MILLGVYSSSIGPPPARTTSSCFTFSTLNFCAFLLHPFEDVVEIELGGFRETNRVDARDDEVGVIVDRLKNKGLTSPYLRPFVVARINPIRFSKSTEFDFDDVLDRMLKNAAKFNIDRVRQEDVVRAGGGAAAEGED